MTARSIGTSHGESRRMARLVNKDSLNNNQNNDDTSPGDVKPSNKTDTNANDATADPSSHGLAGSGDGGMNKTQQAVEAYRDGMADAGAQFLTNTTGAPTSVTRKVADKITHGQDNSLLNPVGTMSAKVIDEIAKSDPLKDVDTGGLEHTAPKAIAAAVGFGGGSPSSGNMPSGAENGGIELGSIVSQTPKPQRRVNLGVNDNPLSTGENAAGTPTAPLLPQTPAKQAIQGQQSVLPNMSGSAIPSLSNPNGSSSGKNPANKLNDAADTAKKLKTAAKVAAFIVSHLHIILPALLIIYIIGGVASCAAMGTSSDEGQLQQTRPDEIPTVALGDEENNDMNNLSVGDAIAKLAVYMAATASPEERIPGPQGDPWTDNGDPRIDNLVKIMDATLGAWGGNNAYASCCQAACGVIAAAADPDIAPAKCPDQGSLKGGVIVETTNDPWEEGMGGSSGPAGTMWYAKARPELYKEVGESLPISDLKPGDLLVSKSHVMIYVGDEFPKERFPNTDGNFYEAAFNDGPGGNETCLYAGLCHRDNIDGFTVFRLKRYNKSASHEIIDWQTMLGIKNDGGGGGGNGMQAAVAGNDVQKKLIEAANNTGWPGQSLCATWTTNVFRNAFGVSFNGDGGDQYRMISNKSQDKDDLQIGMIVACAATGTQAGSTYGHTAIYVGDGYVMESLSGGVQMTQIDDWIRMHPGSSSKPNSYAWGWIPGFDLSTNSAPTSNVTIPCGCPNA